MQINPEALCESIWKHLSLPEIKLYAPAISTIKERIEESKDSENKLKKTTFLEIVKFSDNKYRIEAIDFFSLMGEFWFKKETKENSKGIFDRFSIPFDPFVTLYRLADKKKETLEFIS